MLNNFWIRLRSLFRRKDVEAELDDELRFHLERQVEKYVHGGMKPEQARRRARLELGGLERTKEECRDARGVRLLENFARDMRYGLRMLRKSPTFTAVAVLTLALGIGANTAIFSLVDFLILRPISVKSPGQLVLLMSDWKSGRPSTTFSYPDFQEIRKQAAGIFSDVSAVRMYQMDGLSVNGKSQPLWAAYVTGNFFEQMGIHPARGRLILPSEGRVAGADPVLVLSYSYWKSHFNGDPEIVGKSVLVNGQPLTIVGVAPRGFHGLSAWSDVQGYMPLGMAAVVKDLPGDFLTTRKTARFVLVARMRPDVSLRQAESALNVIAERLSRQHPETEGRAAIRAVHLGPAGLAMNPAQANPLPLASALLLILAGAVLVLACLNVANLYLVRAGIRQREMAMRTALGATRGRLARQLLTESLALAAFGCAAGIILGLGESRLLSSIPLRAPVPLLLDLRFDWRVFAYALAAAALTTVLVGLVPALRVARGDLNEILHEGGRTSTPGGHRLRAALVVAQVAGSLMLLIVAGLFLRSLENVQHTDLGFDPSHVVNFSLDPHEAGYTRAQALAFFQTILDRARALPGVQSASLASTVPMDYVSVGASPQIPGYEPPPGRKAPSAGFNTVSSQYFETMRIPIVAGRGFRRSDGRNSQPVAVVNKAMADRYWHGRSPIGRTFRLRGEPGHPIKVIGVVKNSRADDIFTENEPFFYRPLFQHFDEPFATLQVRGAMPPASLSEEVISLVHALDPVMPVFNVQSMTDALNTLNGFLLFRFAAALAAALGLLGLLLAVVGVYGIVSYAASQRTHEIGIRMALGAQPRQIRKMILGQGFVIAAIGVVAGILAAAALSNLVGSFLVGVTPHDPLSYAAASLFLVLVVLAASYAPARRATKLDPTTALRCE
jgi:predicted permease